MRNSSVPKDTDLLGALPALRRAARGALRLAIQTGTPCYVIRAGKIVNIAAKRPAIKGRSSRARQSARETGTPQVTSNGKTVHVKMYEKNSRLSRKRKVAGA